MKKQKNGCVFETVKSMKLLIKVNGYVDGGEW
jgi:hypothetical protein